MKYKLPITKRKEKGLPTLTVEETQRRAQKANGKIIKEGREVIKDKNYKQFDEAGRYLSQKGKAIKRKRYE